jgi:hypothetical protein
MHVRPNRQNPIASGMRLNGFLSESVDAPNMDAEVYSYASGKIFVYLNLVARVDLVKGKARWARGNTESQTDRRRNWGHPRCPPHAGQAKGPAREPPASG